MLSLVFLVAVCGAVPLLNKSDVDQLVVLNDNNTVDSMDLEREVLVHVPVNADEGVEAHRSRVKRFITRNGHCPVNYVKMPPPLGCIPYSEFKELTE